jgi:hypothetical protein
MVIFVFIVVFAACACFAVAWDGFSPLSALLVQQVLHTWCIAQVSHGCVFIVFCKFFIVWCVDLNVLIAGDLRHVFSQSAWGFPFREPPGSWLHLLQLGRGSWHFCDNDCHCGISFVVILTTFSWLLCCICPWGCLVAPRLITTALLVALKALLSHERFCASQWCC